MDQRTRFWRQMVTFHRETARVVTETLYNPSSFNRPMACLGRPCIIYVSATDRGYRGNHLRSSPSWEPRFIAGCAPYHPPSIAMTRPFDEGTGDIHRRWMSAFRPARRRRGLVISNQTHNRPSHARQSHIPPHITGTPPRRTRGTREGNAGFATQVVASGGPCPRALAGVCVGSDREW
jgi:hypothetical protein